mgnify:CR=1 FL=1
MQDVVCYVLQILIKILSYPACDDKECMKIIEIMML